MINISFPIKILLISAVISLLPVAVDVSPLDYHGASLQAADEDKKKKKEEGLSCQARKHKGSCKAYSLCLKLNNGMRPYWH